MKGFKSVGLAKQPSLTSACSKTRYGQSWSGKKKVPKALKRMSEQNICKTEHTVNQKPSE